MKRFTSSIQTLLFTRRPIYRGLLLLGGTLGLLARAHGQDASVTFSNIQTVTAQPTTFTETFANASVTGGAPALGTGTYMSSGGIYGNANFTGLGTNSFTTTNGNAASPLGSSSDKFLAVGSSLLSGVTTGENSPVTASFTGAVHYVGLLWGSPDAANTLTLNFSDGSNTVYTAASIGLTIGSTSDYVNFVTPANVTISSAVFTNNGDSFEVDNFAFGVVPEPATWLGGGLLLGLAAWTLRRRLALGFLA